MNQVLMHSPVAFVTSVNVQVLARAISSKPRLNLKRPRTIHRRTRTTMTRVDGHVHVWDPSYETHPDHPLPSLPASFPSLLAHMDASGVDKTLIVQPINYMFDHTYISAACAAHPTRFYLVALADTTKAPDEAVALLRALNEKSPLKGIRINPTLAPGGFESATVAALLKTAGDLSLPACMFARPQHLGTLGKLLANASNTNIILDHFAFADDNDAQSQVLALATAHSNLFIKTSAWFRVSKTEWPHSDLNSFLRKIIDAIGPQRLIFGSDYPFVQDQYEYAKAHAVLSEAGLSEEERRWIAGESAVQLYKL